MTVAASPLPKYKYRATFDDGPRGSSPGRRRLAHVDFGAKGSEDYTTHRDPHRMSFFLLRHGGISSREYHALKEENGNRVHAKMRGVVRSSKENWKDPHTAGFWSRWLLWSHPSLRSAVAEIRSRFGLRVRIHR